MHGMEKELTEGLQTNFKKTSKMANLKYQSLEHLKLNIKKKEKVEIPKQKKLQ